jgi:hypothetical protein
MANNQWGRDWYEAPTEITRNGQTYYFVGNIENGCGTFTKVGVRRLKEVGKQNNISIRVIRRAANNYVSEVWASLKWLDDLAHAERII